jgi:hypothetical protein
MRFPLLAGALLALHLTSSVWPRPAHSQWLVEVEVGSDRFWGGSVEAGPEHRSFRPYHPATFGTGLERRWSSLGIGLRLQYADASLALEGGDAVTAVKGVFTVYSASPDVSYKVASVGSENELRVGVGPLFEVWSIVDEKSRTRIGIQGTVRLGIPLGSRFAGVLSAGVAIIPSPFEGGELTGYDLRALWRRRFAVGLRYGL